jgi:putative aldouronate transport system permease protein
MKYNTTAYRVFTIFNYVFLVLLAFACIVPMIHILAVSLSSKAAATANLVGLWPVQFTPDAYTETIGNRYFMKAAGIGLARAIVGPVFSMLVTVMAAFPLARETSEFRSRNRYMWFFVFVMFFNGGLIPSYMVVRSLGLINSFWVLILPMGLNVYNLILLVNFFRTSVPKALEEAAYIDGASYIRTLFKIYIPIAVPAIATLSLFNIVIHWNSYFDGLVYMTSRENYPLSTFLQTIVVSENFSATGLTADQVKKISERTIKASQIFLSLIPVLMIYPFLQRFFIKGIVLGSVKE